MSSSAWIIHRWHRWHVISANWWAFMKNRAFCRWLSNLQIISSVLCPRTGYLKCEIYDKYMIYDNYANISPLLFPKCFLLTTLVFVLQHTSVGCLMGTHGTANQSLLPPIIQASDFNDTLEKNTGHYRNDLAICWGFLLTALDIMHDVTGTFEVDLSGRSPCLCGAPPRLPQSPLMTELPRTVSQGSISVRHDHSSFTCSHPQTKYFLDQNT